MNWIAQLLRFVIDPERTPHTYKIATMNWIAQLLRFDDLKKLPIEATQILQQWIGLLNYWDWRGERFRMKDNYDCNNELDCSIIEISDYLDFVCTDVEKVIATMNWIAQLLR